MIRFSDERTKETAGTRVVGDVCLFSFGLDVPEALVELWSVASGRAGESMVSLASTHGRVNRTADISPYTSEALHKAWYDVLSPYQWDAFGTLTYDPKKRRGWCRRDPGVSKLLRDMGAFVFRWTEATFAREGLLSYRERRDRDGEVIKTLKRSSYWKVMHHTPVWAMGVEKHKSGDPHLHCLIHEVPGCPTLSRRVGWDVWLNVLNNGRNRIEPPKSQADVLRYCSNYVAKGGDVYVSDNFMRVLKVASGESTGQAGSVVQPHASGLVRSTVCSVAWSSGQDADVFRD